MIVHRPKPEKGTCFAWLPVRTPDGKVWLEHVHYKWNNRELGSYSYERIKGEPVDFNEEIMFSEQLHGVNAKHLGDIPEYATPPDPKTFCKNYRADGPTPCEYPMCLWRNEDGSKRCGIKEISDVFRE